MLFLKWFTFTISITIVITGKSSQKGDEILELYDENLSETDDFFFEKSQTKYVENTNFVHSDYSIQKRELDSLDTKIFIKLSNDNFSTFPSTQDTNFSSNMENSSTTFTKSDFFQKQSRQRSNSSSATLLGDLKFATSPPGVKMKSPQIKLGEGYLAFDLVTKMMRFLQPRDFPSELVKDWAWGRLSNTQLFLEIIHVEGGFLGLIIILFILTLTLPSAIILHVCCKITSDRTESDHYSEMSDHELRCRRFALIALLDIILILLPVGIVGMFTANEQLTVALQKLPEVHDAVWSDLDEFIRNTHLQIRFVATSSVDRAVDAAISSLEETEELLGIPIQRELSIETGLDVALDALSDVSMASKDVANEVLNLRAEAQAAREAARISQEKLRELKRQVDTTKKQCVEKDRVLCDTIDTNGLEVIFKIDKILAERKLSKLKNLGEDNLTQAIAEVRLEYQDIPQKIVRETENTRKEIKQILNSQRDRLYNSIKSIEEISDAFTNKIHATTSKCGPYVNLIAENEQWRWLGILISCLLVLLIWIILVSAVVCANCGCESRVGPSLYSAVGLLVIFILGFWGLASAGLLIGGNGDMFICRPLNDDPNYATLTMLMDHPGLLYKNGGFFSNIINGNDSLNVPIKHILRECRLNQPAFSTFNLNRVFNIDSVTNHVTWPKLHQNLNNLTVEIKDIEILKPALQKNLQDLSQASKVNLTSYRTQISGLTTGTDLNSFADQLERIANQMIDLTTSARMETLASRTRKLFSNNIQKLEKHKEEIIYKLTTLEVHLLPLQRQANQSLSHLKTIQYYISNQGTNISEKKTKQFVEKVVKYLERFREHVLNELTYEAAPCRPLYDAFQTTRNLLCENIVESVNGFWTSTTWCLLFFMALTPIAMILASDYCYYANQSLGRDLGELLLSEQTAWQTPGTPQSTPESTSAISGEQAVWTTPRRTSEQLLVPPRSASPERERRRFPSPRRLGIVGIGGERRETGTTRQRESIRLLEQIMPWYAHHATAGVPAPPPRGYL